MYGLEYSSELYLQFSLKYFANLCFIPKLFSNVQIFIPNSIHIIFKSMSGADDTAWSSRPPRTNEITI